MSQKNLALIFNSIPDGLPKPGKDLIIKDIGYDPNVQLPPDSLSLEVLYVSLDPYLRGRLRPQEVKSYFPALPIGQPISNGGLARVLKSNADGFVEGDLVGGYLPFQQYLTATGRARATLTKIPTEKGPEDIRHWLGALGLAGQTAYSSLYEIGQPKKGETIFISSAAGAVGQIVGELCKHEGLTVIGSVGSDEKLKYITEELSFDSGFNYKKERPGDALQRLAPNGIDIYYENVGGEHLEAAIDALNNHGRIVACGMISEYSAKPEECYGVKNLMQVVGKRLTMRGFIASDEDFGPKYKDELYAKVGQWLRDGTFKAKIHETSNFEDGPAAFLGMLTGENFGKALLKVQA